MAKQVGSFLSRWSSIIPNNVTMCIWNVHASSTNIHNFDRRSITHWLCFSFKSSPENYPIFVSAPDYLVQDFPATFFFKSASFSQVSKYVIAYSAM